MREYINWNYISAPWTEDFVGVEKLGGICRSGRYRPVCYVVRVPMNASKSRAVRKCPDRESAERVFLEEMEGLGGWEGDVPYRDCSYKRRKNAHRKERSTPGDD